MAGHSQFKNIMHRKGAQDAKRARQFAKLIREITVSARQGLPDPAANPRLRAAMAAAREANMPRDTIERAVKKATGGAGGDDYAEVRYEGYGPAGVAVIVEALTDNRNRTAGDVRSAFTKNGGALGETNAVSFMFNRVGAIGYKPEAASSDAMLEDLHRRRVGARLLGVRRQPVRTLARAVADHARPTPRPVRDDELLRSAPAPSTAGQRP